MDWREYQELRYKHNRECQFGSHWSGEVYCSCWSKDHFCTVCNKVFCRNCGWLVDPITSFHDEPPTRREKEFRTRKFFLKKWSVIFVKNVKCQQNVINVGRQI